MESCLELATFCIPPEPCERHPPRVEAERDLRLPELGTRHVVRNTELNRAAPAGATATDSGRSRLCVKGGRGALEKQLE